MPGWDSTCWPATCLVTGGTVLLGKCGEVTNDVISGILKLSRLGLCCGPGFPRDPVLVADGSGERGARARELERL